MDKALHSLPSHNVMLLGDFNINMLNDGCYKTENFIDVMQTLHFLPIITKPTRFPAPPNIRSENPSLIDHIWLNNLPVYSGGILMLDVTDHCPIFVRLPVQSSDREKVKISFRPHTEGHILHFIDTLCGVDWSLSGESTVDANTDKFIRRLNETYCTIFPLKSKSVGVKRLEKPWLTRGILNSIKTRSTYFKLSKLGTVNYDEYREYRNKLTSVIRTAKYNYFKNSFRNCISDTRQTWKLIKRLLGQQKFTPMIKRFLVEGREITDSSEIAEEFNNYFVNIADKLDAQLPKVDISPLSYINVDVCSSLFLKPITPQECFKIISSLKNSSCKNNSVPVMLWKRAKSCLVDPICFLINQSIENGIFPSSLKISHVAPIFKSGDRSDISNYRPISVLPILSKVFERFLYDQLLVFFIRHSLISPDQFGFRKGLSTVNSIIGLTEKIYDALNNRNHSANIFVDFRKAFDTVNHAILISKLRCYGVRGLALKYVHSYLTDRRQCVRVGSCLSTEKSVNMGVPQGSLLGPLLFLMYVNDVSNCSELLSTVLYADDTCFSLAHPDFDVLQQRVNAEIEKFRCWTLVNRLSVNLDKTYSMLVTNRRGYGTKELSVSFGGQKLESTVSYKYLGVILDNRMNYSEHIGSICSKLSRSIGILYKLKPVLPCCTLLSLYYSLIYPYIIYCNEVWGGTSGCHLNRLIVLQKRAVRIITGADYLAHTAPLFAKTKILKINDVHTYLLCLHMFKNLQCNSSLYPRGGLRRAHDVRPVFQRLSVSQRSLRYSAPKAWNNISDRLKSSNYSSRLPFKTGLKSYLIEKY